MQGIQFRRAVIKRPERAPLLTWRLTLLGLLAVQGTSDLTAARDRVKGVLE